MADMSEIKRRFRREMAGVNTWLLVIFCAVSLVLCILFAINGISRELCDTLVMPSCMLLPFFFGLFYIVALCLLSCSAAFVFSSCLCVRWEVKRVFIFLYAASLSLFCIWIPLTWKAGAFFASSLLGAVLLCVLTYIHCESRRISRISSIFIIPVFIWAAYLLYLSFALFLIN